MHKMLGTTKNYSIVILKGGPRRKEPGIENVIWEHGRRNFMLRAGGPLAIVCPVRDESEICGIGIFNANVEKTREIMDEDPGVKAGIFIYEVHATRSFPGDCLPK